MLTFTNKYIKSLKFKNNEPADITENLYYYDNYTFNINISFLGREKFYRNNELMLFNKILFEIEKNNYKSSFFKIKNNIKMYVKKDGEFVTNFDQILQTIINSKYQNNVNIY